MLFVSAALIFLLRSVALLSEAVSPGQLGKLTRERLLNLDREVSEYYDESYSVLDDRPASNRIKYDDQLYRSVRAIRHTNVLNHFDFKYTRNETKWASMGDKVNRHQCKHQLRLLVKIANKLQQSNGAHRVPLSIADFFGASGQSGDGVLNGNFVWLGSYISCERARIASFTWRQYIADELDQDTPVQQHRLDINGRYCVAHLRAVSWPKWDEYFEDRLTLKRGICLPESCHSAVYDSDDEIRRLVDILARHDLRAPFNGDHYEISDLYCFPDENSSFRQLDLGAKLFIVFVSGWAVFTIYTNVLYYTQVRSIANAHMVDEMLQKHLPKKSGEPEELTETDRLNNTDPLKPDEAGLYKHRSPSNRSDCLDIVRAFSVEVNLMHLCQPRATQPTSTGSSHKPQTQAKFKDCKAQRSANGAKEDPDSNTAPVEDPGQRSALSRSGDESGGVRMVPDAKSGDNDNGPRRRINIDVLDGLKVIGTGWIVAGHTLMFFFGCVTDLRFAKERMLDIMTTSSINTLQVVGLFYIITGCLLTYSVFVRASKRQLQKPLFWLLVLVGRYVRLIPAYALVFWFARHVAPHTGRGHGWYEYRTDHEYPRGACANESWWIMWTMSAADIKLPLGCVPQAWYLSDDFRTLFVLPIYVLLLANNARLGYCAIIATFIISNLKLVHILRTANIDYKILLKLHPHTYAIMTDRLHDVYTNSLVRLSTYLLGITIGHLLYLYERRHIEQWPKWFREWGMKVALTVGLTFFYGAQLLASPLVNRFLPHRDQIDSDVVVLLIPLFKSAMEFSICVMILLMVTGGGSALVRRILTSQTMKILASISYAVFLTHVEIMYKLPIQRFASSWWQLIIHAIFFNVFTNIVSFILHLLFEMPVHNLTRHLLKRASKLSSE
jgi:hypothetical protein